MQFELKTLNHLQTEREKKFHFSYLRLTPSFGIIYILAARDMYACECILCVEL